MNTFKCLLFLAIMCATGVAQAKKAHIIFAFDCSPSMEVNDRFAKAKRALSQSIRQLPSDATVGILVFGGETQWLYRPGPIDTRAIDIKINQIEYIGSTAIGDALNESSNAMTDLQRQFTGNPEEALFQIVILTDGESNTGRDPARVVPDVAQRSQRVDVIGIEMSDMRLKQILERSGFRENYHTADRIDDLFRVLQEVLHLESIGVDTQGASDLTVLEPIETPVSIELINAIVSASKERRTLAQNPGTHRREIVEVPEKSRGCQAVPGSSIETNNKILYAVFLLLTVIITLRFSPPRRRPCRILRRVSRHRDQRDRP